jgi:sigma-B regulation protein RsbU (phosphoserine phosphatase)
MKILIAEDDLIARSVLEASLRKLGHEPESYTDGEAAWTAFQREPQRVVISDWLMPGIDGLELCRRVRAEKNEYTYFILLSNLSSSGGNLSQAIDAGVDDFLNKPVNPDELRLRLHVAERILDYVKQVQQLESFIPICSYCKKVRDDENYWDRIENFINARTGSQFSHGICPDCYNQMIVPQMKAQGLQPPPPPSTERMR